MLNDEIRRLRKASGLNQVSFADKMDVSQSTVASWENGTRRPDLDALCRIADLFDVSLDELLCRKQSSADPLTPSESELISIFRDLNDKGQAVMMATAQSLATNPDMRKGSVSNTATG